MEYAATKVIQALLIPTGVFAGMSLLANKVNSNTAEMVNLSRATGFAMNDMKAMGLVAKEMGFTFEHINSLAEEWNNKIAGEKAGFAENNMREGLAAMGMSIKDVIDLKPDEAFEKIMNAGRDMVKNGKFDEFASAADKIYGQEANRMLTAFAQKMHDSDRDFSAFLGNYKDFVSVTGSAQNGAVKFTNMWNKGIAMVEKQFANFFGEVGNILGYSEDQFDELLKSFGHGTKEIRQFLLKYVVKSFNDFIRIMMESKNWVVDNKDALIEMGERGYKALLSLMNIGINLVKTIMRLEPALSSVALALAKVIEGVTWLLDSELTSWLLTFAANWWLVTKAVAAYNVVTKAAAASTLLTSLTSTAGILPKLALGWTALKGSMAATAVAGAPIFLWAAALTGVVMGLKAVIDEFETVKALLTQPWWTSAMELYNGFTYDEDTAGQLTPEEQARNKQAKLNRDKAQRLREMGMSKEQIKQEISNDNSNSTQYITNNNQISDTQTAQEMTGLLLNPANIGG